MCWVSAPGKRQGFAHKHDEAEEVTAMTGETADGKPQSPSLAKVCMCNGFVGPGHPAVH